MSFPLRISSAFQTKLRIWSLLLKKSSAEHLIFCAVIKTSKGSSYWLNSILLPWALSLHCFYICTKFHVSNNSLLWVWSFANSPLPWKWRSQVHLGLKLGLNEKIPFKRLSDKKTFGINEIFQETVLENFAAFSEKLRKHIF